ncbi:hypothetical protein [Stakelama tenebrarum]|uniref:Secreted protein n=1 Tax=Stakelama tenebrarum TaxID=2711215 RepID=A0A6G6Y718_9SPHN|nr:hypothetical protein [Sphingosinithalassobacter tenebrarum]QIG80373.1 hypothetical protein G5C33_11690 [Sphingosinithalassobacter tenebrarum]
MFRLSICGLIALAATLSAAKAQQVQQVQPIGLPVSQPGEGLPADFEGKVHYFGNHSGDISVLRSTGDQPRRRNTDCPRPDQGCPDPVGGSLEVTLEFEGEVVRGEFRGTGGLRDSRLVGRRQGAECRLFDITDGSVWSGRCDSEAFVGSVQSVPNAAIQIHLAFEAVGTRTVDYAERERLRREAILMRRRIALLESQLDGNGPIETRFEAAIELDSLSWEYDEYIPGSLTAVDRGRERDDRYQIYGEFALTDGGTGWARADVDHDAIVCIEFWDIPGYCRPIVRPVPPEIPEPYDPRGESGASLIPRQGETVQQPAA